MRLRIARKIRLALINNQTDCVLCAKFRSGSPLFLIIVHGRRNLHLHALRQP